MTRLFLTGLVVLGYVSYMKHEGNVTSRGSSRETKGRSSSLSNVGASLADRNVPPTTAQAFTRFTYFALWWQKITAYLMVYVCDTCMLWLQLHVRQNNRASGISDWLIDLLLIFNPFLSFTSQEGSEWATIMSWGIRISTQGVHPQSRGNKTILGRGPYVTAIHRLSYSTNMKKRHTHETTLHSQQSILSLLSVVAPYYHILRLLLCHSFLDCSWQDLLYNTTVCTTVVLSLLRTTVVVSFTVWNAVSTQSHAR